MLEKPGIAGIRGEGSSAEPPERREWELPLPPPRELYYRLAEVQFTGRKVLCRTKERFTATPDLVEQGDQIFESHAAWMAESHYREDEKALLRHNVVKGPELSNPLDPSSEPTGNTCLVLMEVYESKAGLEDHWRQGTENWNCHSQCPIESPTDLRRCLVHTAKLQHLTETSYPQIGCSHRGWLGLRRSSPAALA